MSIAIDKFEKAQQEAVENRPRLTDFLFLAETLRRAKVLSIIWTLPELAKEFTY